jgi:hypothetical protein
MKLATLLLALSTSVFAAEVPRITSGPWEGLELRVVPRDNLSAINDFIEPDHPAVNAFFSRLNVSNPSWSNRCNLEKAELIYNLLRPHYKYDSNPYDLAQNDEDFFIRNPELKGDVIGVQTVSETLKFGRGDCEDLSILLASYYRAAGIDSHLAWIKNEDAWHIIVFFDSGLKRDDDSALFVYSDPSYFETHNFSENLKLCTYYINLEKYWIHDLDQ